jgi:hypothetical protein
MEEKESINHINNNTNDSSIKKDLEQKEKKEQEFASFLFNLKKGK